MKKKGGEGEDGAALWRRVARSVRAYAPEKPGKESAPAPKKSSPRAKPVARTVVPPPPKKPPAATGFDAATKRRLKRGQIRPEARLDLHGLSQTAARDALEVFLRRARAEGLRTVLVITGKGRGAEGGVLRRAVPEWLAGEALACLPARPEDGGAGALYVRLGKVG